VALSANSPFRGGPARLARCATIVQVADKHGATPAQTALAWLLAGLALDDADLAVLDRV
jgi:diketogulonate reductase-like aldo/keto reductase